MILDRLLIALRLKKAAPARARLKMPPVYRGHVPSRPMPSPTPWRRSFEAERSEAPTPVFVASVAPPPGADSFELPPEPALFRSGEGGDFVGAGASARWETTAEAAPAPEPEPSSSSLSDSSSSDSSSSDSSSSSSSSD